MIALFDRIPNSEQGDIIPSIATRPGERQELRVAQDQVHLQEGISIRSTCRKGNRVDGNVRDAKRG